MILLTLIACLCLTTTTGLECLSCENDCGEVGHLDCIDCSCAPNCSAILCSSSRECVLESQPCNSEPCPKMPSCVDFTKTCHGSPLRDHDSPIFCHVDAVQCPRGYSCSKVLGHPLSVCCEDRSRDIDPPISAGVPSIFWPPSNEASDLPDDNECGNCPFDPCEMVDCPAHPTAQCVTDDCACESWFIASGAEGKEVMVDCHGDVPPEKVKTVPPHSFDNPGKIETPHLSPIGVSKNNVTKTTTRVTPSSSTSDIIINVTIVTGLLFTVAILLLLGCKMYHHKKKTSHAHKEQLKPLQAVNGESKESA